MKDQQHNRRGGRSRTTSMEAPQNTGAVEKDEKCPKCKRNVKSKAVLCEKCFIWTHYRCLGKTEEQIEKEYPHQLVCKECTDGKEVEKSVDKKEKKVTIHATTIRR